MQKDLLETESIYNEKQNKTSNKRGS
jgi:hypothetical protein